MAGARYHKVFTRLWSSPGFRSAPDDQRLYCARRDLCLDVAADRGWPALTCARCVAYEPMELAQIQADVAPLVSILCETIKPIPVLGYRRSRR